MQLVNKATIKMIRDLGKRKRYSYRHIQTLVDIEGYGRPALSFIYGLLGGKKKKIKRIL